ncbi:Ger(x)C family spore germination protein [Paenisporosarcina sp. TG-14]|uniref:Ger(x)C family spore germination protein n=1 Tax=Paenisporosarcina sp. TG-14 TaxID=1231057 RepID=UPI0002D544B2|nr:Ger(x)C family spore germination protein [Paenisporosarcina sp. TG-14]
MKERLSFYEKGGIITKQKKALMLISMITLIMVSGCWNRVELNEIALSLAMGLDKKGDQITVYHQIVNPSALLEEGGSLAPVTLYQETGNTIQEANRKMTKKSTRKIFLNQIKILIVSEELAKEGLTEALDHVYRDHDFRKDFFVVVTKDTEVADILKVLTKIDPIPATKMISSLENSANVWGSTTPITIDQLMADIISNGKEAALTGIEVNGNPEQGETRNDLETIQPSALIAYSGIAVFKKDKLVGWLNEEESKGYNFTQGKIKSTAVVFPCPSGENDITVEVFHNQADMKFKLENDQPKIDVKIALEGTVTDVECDIDLMKTETINEIEKLTEKEIKKSIAATIQTAQEKYNSDIFGFGDVINRTNPKYWGKIEGDWEKVFQDLQVNIEMEAKILRVFKQKKSLSERMEN